MKQHIYILILILFLLGCENPKAIENQIIKKEVQKKTNFILDTVLEKNNPKSLDLTKHQLFIDTTRNSKFYKSLINWKPSKFDIASVKRHIEQLDEISKSKKVNFGDFPKSFVRINKLNNEFYLYDRCDGIDPRYELRDNVFISYGPLETDAETIKNFDKINSTNIKLKLNRFIVKVPHILEISKTEYQNIYSMKYQNGLENFIIPTTDILKYDLIVNNCPERKVIEYLSFH